MAQVLRRFGFKKGEHRESEARLRLRDELFQFNKCAEHGFPHKPSAIAFDPKLQLLAIGTKTGVIRVFGAPGVEFTGVHQCEEEVSVTQLFFLPEQARLISLCSDNSLHLWEVNVKPEGYTILEETKQFSMEASKLKNISACALTSTAEQLLIGTEGGNIQTLDVKTFKLSDHIVYQDVVMQNVQDDFKLNPGAVEAILPHPSNPDKFLVGYNRGLIVLWDNKESNADQTYNATQQLDSLAWHRDGTQFMSAHADGSYIVWSTTDSTKPKEQAITPYGPFPCKAINKIVWKTAKPEPFIIFSGGMPRASYGDKHTVTVMQGNNNHTVFDLSSKIVDFILINDADMVDDDKYERDDPHTLLVLAEEELVAVDLQVDAWPTFRLPYLGSIHSTAITCSQHVSNVPEPLWTKIVEAGESQQGNTATRDWPIGGGKLSGVTNTHHNLLLTGHEDGSVRFWDATSVSLKLLYHLRTASVFDGDMQAEPANEEEEWPPFRKVGTFDPYSDDPRLGIQKIQLCTLSETLVIAGTAGQVVVCQFERDEKELEVKTTTVNIVGDRDNFVWKGHSALTAKAGETKFPAGFQPVAVMQLHPPAACTALALHTEWQLVSAGTAHGFGVFDYTQKKEVTTKCTLNPQDLTGTGESAMSRRKSFKKSLRQSFRRLRKRRSERRRQAEAKQKEDEKEKKEEEKKPEEPAAASSETPAEGAASAEAAPSTEAAGESAPAPEAAATTPPATTPTTETQHVETKTVERQIEARAVDDAMGSMVRCLFFADTFLINAQAHTPTLWAGTNAGAIYVFQITLPSNDKRDSEAVQCVLAKEIQLKHRAPVISISIFDRNAAPLPGAFEVHHERVKPPDMTGNHQVLICSEEQFKIFSLPSLKAQNKFKLTAHEGSKIRKIGVINFRSRSDENYNENDLACLTNQGELNIFSVPQLRRQMKVECIKKENVTGIGSCVFANNGEGYFLHSPSELVRFSLSARYINKPKCEIELKEGMREPPEPEAEEEQGSGDAPAEEDKHEEGAPDGAGDTTVDSANLTVDSANITADDIKVHLSEESSTRVVSSSVVTSSTVVQRTIIKESTTNEDGETETRVSETTTVTRSEGGGDEAPAPAEVTAE